MLSSKCHLEYLGERQAERLLQLGVFFLKKPQALGNSGRIFGKYPEHVEDKCSNSQQLW